MQMQMMMQTGATRGEKKMMQTGAAYGVPSGLFSSLELGTFKVLDGHVRYPSQVVQIAATRRRHYGFSDRLHQLRL